MYAMSRTGSLTTSSPEVRPVGARQPDGEPGMALRNSTESGRSHFEQMATRHILGDKGNRRRLEQVPKDALGSRFNEHLVFRAIYGDIQLKWKEEVVLPQW